MPITITMPRYGATMEEGTITYWAVKEGQAVSKGDMLCEISIEKLTNELLAEEDGVVLKILAEEGDTLACGQPMLTFGKSGESLNAADEPVEESMPAAVETDAAAEKTAVEIVGDPAPTLVAPSFGGEYVESAKITPKGLELAKELGIDYHFIKGTGRFGMITREDIRAAVDAGTSVGTNQALVTAAAPMTVVTVSDSTNTSEQEEALSLTVMQQAIAKAMENSLKTTAQTTISMDLDASSMVQAYRKYKETYQQGGVKLTYTAILIKIVAEALVDHKLLRTVIVGSNLFIRSAVNIGVAIDIPDGLVVPNLKNCHQNSVRQIAIELEDVATRARNNALTVDEMSGGVFTITNLGMMGIKYFTPILNPGESAILGIGTLQEVPTIQNGGIYVKPVINLSLTHDHRVIMGAPAARFLQAIQQFMDNTETTLKG